MVGGWEGWGWITVEISFMTRVCSCIYNKCFVSCSTISEWLTETGYKTNITTNSEIFTFDLPLFTVMIFPVQF